MEDKKNEKINIPERCRRQFLGCMKHLPYFFKETWLFFE